MLHVCVRTFDVTGIVEIFLGTKQGLNFQEQHDPSDSNKTWIPIMSQQMTTQKTYQRRTTKKGLQCIFWLNFCHLLPRTLDSDPIQSFSESYHQGSHPEVALSHKLILNEAMQTV